MYERGAPPDAERLKPLRDSEERRDVAGNVVGYPAGLVSVRQHIGCSQNLVTHESASAPRGVVEKTDDFKLFCPSDVDCVHEFHQLGTRGPDDQQLLYFVYSACLEKSSQAHRRRQQAQCRRDTDG